MSVSPHNSYVEALVGLWETIRVRVIRVGRS